MIKTFRISFLLITLVCTCSIASLAVQIDETFNNQSVQDEEYLPYDQWYGPDNTIDTVPDDNTENVVLPDVPDTDDRVAPEEDWRPQAR